MKRGKKTAHPAARALPLSPSERERQGAKAGECWHERTCPAAFMSLAAWLKILSISSLVLRSCSNSLPRSPPFVEDRHGSWRVGQRRSEIKRDREGARSKTCLVTAPVAHEDHTDGRCQVHAGVCRRMVMHVWRRGVLVGVCRRARGADSCVQRSLCGAEPDRRRAAAGSAAEATAMPGAWRATYGLPAR